MSAGDGITRSALIEGNYRYVLMRQWRPKLRGVTFVMLNPSTADHENDDPTIRRCINFAEAWGYGQLAVVNLYAWRATKPADLCLASDLFGKNRLWVEESVRDADVLCAWGAMGGVIPCNHSVDSGDARRHVLATTSALLQTAELIVGLAKNVQCLGFTTNGHPRHPLYVRKTQERVQCRDIVRQLFTALR